MTERKCANCMWWDRPMDASTGEGGRYGQCRAIPPLEGRGFPLVHEGVWCGAFRMKEPSE